MKFLKTVKNWAMAGLAAVGFTSTAQAATVIDTVALDAAQADVLTDIGTISAFGITIIVAILGVVIAYRLLTRSK